MIRLFVWLFWVLVVGRRPPEALPNCVRCESQFGWLQANCQVPYCDFRLCAEHCDYHCKCLPRQIAERSEVLS